MVSPVRAVWRDMAPQRRELAVAGVLGAVASISAVALLGSSAWLISRAAEMPPVLTLSVAAVLVRTFALSRSVARYLERLVGHDAAFRGLTALRVTVYEQLRRLAPTGLAAFGRGDLLQRLVADVDAALDLPLRVVLPWTQAVLVSGASVAFLVWLLPPAAGIVAVLALVALALVPWAISRIARREQARTAPARGALSGAVVELLDATAELAAFGAGGAALSTVRTHDEAVTALARRESLALGLGGGLGIVVQGAAVALSLAVAIPAVTDGRLAPVWLAVAALLPLALFDVLAGLPGAALAYQRLASSAGRLDEITRTASPVVEPGTPAPLPLGFDGLVVAGVTATWPQAGEPAIRDITLRLAPGERVAVVGPSGSGKSTLAAVLMGFLPYQGSITVSGVELRDAGGEQVRTRVGLLTQQSHVFDTSLADNVRLGDPQAGAEQLGSALRRAQLEGWVAQLPAGVDTIVGAFGSAISGGERQRIALARLLLADRPLVILDEPTEHLDATTAHPLAATLAEGLADRSVLLITHRLGDLVERIDRIVVLEDGRVTASGTHEQLASSSGWYARQWREEAEQDDMAALLPRLPVGVGVDRSFLEGRTDGSGGGGADGPAPLR